MLGLLVPPGGGSLEWMRPQNGAVRSRCPPTAFAGISSSEESNPDPMQGMRHLLFPKQRGNLQSRTSWPPGSLPEAQWPQRLPLDHSSEPPRRDPSCLLSLPSLGHSRESAQLTTLPRDVGGPSGLLDQSNLICRQQVVSRASHGAPLPPRGRPGNRVLFVEETQPWLALSQG